MTKPRRKRRAPTKQPLDLNIPHGLEPYVKAWAAGDAEDERRIAAEIAQLDPEVQQALRRILPDPLAFQLQVRVPLEVELKAAEDAANRLLLEHKGVVEEAIAKLTPDEQKAARSTAGGVFGPVPVVQHDEPGRWRRPCWRCDAARRLLFQLRELRSHLASRDIEAVALYALLIGRLQLRMGLLSLEDDAECGAEETKNRREGARVLHGGTPGVMYREARDAYVVKEYKDLCDRFPEWGSEKLMIKIAETWNSALAAGRVEAPPPGVKGTLTKRNVKAILQKRNVKAILQKRAGQ